MRSSIVEADNAKRALASLQQCTELLNNVIFPSLAAIAPTTVDCNANKVLAPSELRKQYSEKHQVLQRLVANITENVSIIKIALERGEYATLAGMIRQEGLSAAFEVEQEPKDEIAEFRRFGLRNLFTLAGAYDSATFEHVEHGNDI